MAGEISWSVEISTETDEAVRAHLGQAGMSDENLSRFVEEAVNARLAHLSPEELQSDIVGVAVEGGREEASERIKVPNAETRAAIEESRALIAHRARFTYPPPEASE